jgi:hypothetical protein
MKMISLAALALAALISGCSAPVPRSAFSLPACPSGDARTQTSLYFGLSRPQGADITAPEWQSFVDKEITPRFKEGLTVFDARGQWLEGSGKIARENSKVLMVIHPPGEPAEQNIEALRTRYKQQFQQESVMRVDSPVCVAF